MANVQKRQGKHGTSYLIRVFIGEDANGKQIMRSKTWKPPDGMTERQTEKELQRQIVLFEQESLQGLTPIDSRIKFAEYAAIWMESTPQSYNYRKRNTDLLKRINKEIGYIPLARLQPRHLQALYRSLAQPDARIKAGYAVFKDLGAVLKQRSMPKARLAADAGISASTVTAAVKGKHVELQTAEKIAGALSIPPNSLYSVHETESGLSPKTILHHHELIRTILAQATREQIIPRNIARGEYMRGPKVRKKEAVFLDDHEAQEVFRLLMHEEDIRIKTAMLLLLFSGVRRGELCGLTWDSIDYDHDIIHITKALQYQSGIGIVEVPTKTESSVRPIKMPSFVMDQLIRYENWWQEQKANLGDLWQGNDGWLFIQWNGSPLNPDTINSWMNRFIEKHHLKHFTPHSLRHTFATLQIAAGVNMRTVQARTGHAQLTTLVNTYTHAIKSANEAAAAVLENMIVPTDYESED